MAPFSTSTCPVLLVSSPSVAEDCLSKNDIIFANRPQILAGEHLAYNYATMGSAPDGPHWRDLRPICTIEILSCYRLQTLSGIPAEEVQSLAKALFKECGVGEICCEAEVKAAGAEFQCVDGIIANKRYYGDDKVDVEEAKQVHRFV